MIYAALYNAPQTDVVCWHHPKFVMSSERYKVVSISTWKTPKDASQPLPTTAVSRISFHDYLFLVTGRDSVTLSDWHRHLYEHRFTSVSRPTASSGNDLVAAIQTLVRTYGKLSINLNFGLSRSLQWVFIMAGLPPAIKRDFPRHFNLKFDPSGRCLVDAL